MDPSLTALIVAVVGVAGTLVSGVMAHRGALRAKTVELDRAERLRREDLLADERREALAVRRASYAVFNQRLRHFHSVLSKDYFALAAGEARPGQGREREETRQVLRDVYAEAQMVISDTVLSVAGGVVHQLHRIHAVLLRHERGSRPTSPWKTSGSGWNGPRRACTRYGRRCAETSESRRSRSYAPRATAPCERRRTTSGGTNHDPALDQVQLLRLGGPRLRRGGTAPRPRDGGPSARLQDPVPTGARLRTGRVVGVRRSPRPGDRLLQQLLKGPLPSRAQPGQR